MDHFSVGIVGAGDIVNKVHLPVLAAIENVRVVWITDVDTTKARALARSYKTNCVECPKDPGNLPDVDVVLLAIPFGVREPYYAALRYRSGGLYVEKPFSRSVEHHQKLCSWFAPHKLACGFVRRSWGPTLLIKNIIETNLFGELRAIDFGFGGPGIVVGGRYNSNLELAGGGVLFETAVHGIDALLFCSSATSVEFNAGSMISDQGFDLHTVARLTLRTERKSTIDCQLTVSCLEETTEQLQFTFEHAVVAYSIFGDGEIAVTPVGGGRQFRLSGAAKAHPLTVNQTVYDHWCRFLRGISSGEVSWTSASESILTTTVIEKLYQSNTQPTLPELREYQCQ